MLKYSLIGLLGLMVAGSIFATGKQVVTLGHNPGCFELPNTGVQGAIREAVEKAEKQCASPLLQDLKVSIRALGGCNPSDVKATFLCLDE